MHQCGISRLYPGTVHPPQYPRTLVGQPVHLGFGLHRHGACTVFRPAPGFDCLNAYLTPPGDDEAAFIHHGSLVPAQFYLFAELLNRTQSRALAEYCYPRLMQYYAFFTGQAGGSTTADLQSGLRARGTTSTIPAAGTIIRPKRPSMSSGWKSAARLWSQQRTRYGAPASWPILRTCSPTGRTQTGWKRMRSVSPGRFRSTRGTRAPGYFGYVLHDEQGRAAGFLRDASGVNHNMGLGGASPLFAGACTAEQAEGLWEKLASEEHLWSACGLSTVDRSAPYYRRDGYWNGAVWMPYQWMFFKAALDAGKTGFAFRIADTALPAVAG